MLILCSIFIHVGTRVRSYLNSFNVSLFFLACFKNTCIRVKCDVCTIYWIKLQLYGEKIVSENDKQHLINMSIADRYFSQSTISKSVLILYAFIVVQCIIGSSLRPGISFFPQSVASSPCLLSLFPLVIE